MGGRLGEWRACVEEGTAVYPSAEHLCSQTRGFFLLDILGFPIRSFRADSISHLPGVTTKKHLSFLLL